MGKGFNRISNLLIPAWKEAGVESANIELDVRLNVMALIDHATDEQVADILAYIEWGRKNGEHDLCLAGNVMHDLNGIVRKEDCFSPRTSGYAKRMEHSDTYNK